MNVLTQNTESTSMTLKGVRAEVRIEDLLATTRLQQRFTNDGSRHIEAVYTFPLPLDATFLELKVRLGEKNLTGVIAPRGDARETYEEAVSDGDAAILLEQAEPGLYTVNLGNLAPGETAEITTAYGQFLRWDDRQVRFALPTVVAPRYGTPQLEPHQVPQTDLAAEHPFALTLSVFGQLALARIHSPTHAVRTGTAVSGVRVDLQGESHRLDREFVLLFDHPEANRMGALAGPDVDGTAVAVSLALDAIDRSHTPRHYRIVLDCSGSMMGDSIAQARLALLEITRSLREGDRFSLLRFGSTTDALVAEPREVNATSLQELQRAIERIDADLGGTEMLRALTAAAGPGTPEGMPTDLMLITDGEIWAEDPQVDKTIRAIRKIGARVFSVGVGSAVNESFVRMIAERTRGAATFVTPGEDMARQITRHFQRIATPEVGRVEVNWPGPTLREQLPDALFDGDTALVLATLEQLDAETIPVRVHFRSGEVRDYDVPVSHSGEEHAPSTVARSAALSWLRRLEDGAAEVAVQYQLMTEHTACVVVEQRAEDEKSDGLPDLKQVPQMMPAGWGGLGSVAGSAPMMACLDMDASLDFAEAPTAMKSARSLRRAESMDVQSIIGADLISWLQMVLPLVKRDGLAAADLIGLLPESLADALRAGLGDEWSPEDESFLAALLAAAVRVEKAQLSWRQQRIARVAVKKAGATDALVDPIERILVSWKT